MKNINKYQHLCQIISLLGRGFFTAQQAARELKLSERHIRRLLAKFRQGKKKFSALIPRSRPPAWNGLSERMVNKIICLKKERLSRSNQHIAEMVEEKFGKKISSEAVRSILIRNDCYQKTKRERRIFQKLEEKITSFGQMLQMDTLEGCWLKGYRRTYLIAIMDAFSRYILGWKWVDSDNTWNNILVLGSVIVKHGVPGMLYTDNASFFKTIRHNQSVYQKHRPDDEYETTIQRIMLDLGSILVNHKPYQPQGKGRIERFFRFIQDRFISEHTASNLKELNEQFRSWVRWYNAKHVIRTIGCVPKDRLKPSSFKPVAEDLNLDTIFSYQYTRKVDKYNSFSFERFQYIIDKESCKKVPGKCLVAYTIHLYVAPDIITVYWHDMFIQRFRRRYKDQNKS